MTNRAHYLKAPLIGAFLFFTLGVLSACADQLSIRTIKIDHVVDGDTVVSTRGEIIRLLGLNAPEKESEQRQAQPYSLEALLLLKELIADKPVRIIAGQVKKDKYGRTLAYLELQDGTDVQEVLLAKGYGFTVAFPPDIDRLEQYSQAESKARNSNLGVWGDEFWQTTQVDQEVLIQSGFSIHRGHIRSVKKSKKNILLKMGSRLTLSIRHDDWAKYWDFDPQSLQGKVVEARGWSSEGTKTYKGQFFLRIRHPFMMQIQS